MTPRKPDDESLHEELERPSKYDGTLRRMLTLNALLTRDTYIAMSGLTDPPPLQRHGTSLTVFTKWLRLNDALPIALEIVAVVTTRRLALCNRHRAALYMKTPLALCDLLENPETAGVPYRIRADKERRVSRCR